MAKEGRIKLHIDELKEYNNLFDIKERKSLIGQSLTAIRLESGKTQAEIAELLGIKAGTYSTYENGTREMPAELIVRCAILYDIPTDLILQTATKYRDIFDTQKQIDAYNEQLDELKELISAKELNPDVKEMMQAMTKFFENVSDQYDKQFNQNK